MNKLEVGMIFKNTRDICEYMGWEYNYHADRIKKRLNIYCKFSIQNRIITILEVFSDVIDNKIIKQNFKYDIGYQYKSPKSDIRVIGRYRNENLKMYNCICLSDKYKFARSEYEIDKKVGCLVCNGFIVEKGINDVFTTHNYVVKYFINKNEAHSVSYGQRKRINCKCPICGFEQPVLIHDLCMKGFRCKQCDDGISYPNKFICNFLCQLNNHFLTEQSFEWSQHRIYDDYVPTFSIIIENHGEGHYIDGYIRCGGRTLHEEQSNDELKEKLAKENGIEHYIVLDCRKSELEWIKKSVMESELPILLNFKEKDIDWLKCHEYACKSIIKDISISFQSDYNIDRVSKEFHISISTVKKYLKQGNQLGLNDYDKAFITENKLDRLRNGIYQSMAKPLICIDNNYVFGSSAICERHSENVFGENILAQDIARVLKNKRKSTHGFTFKRINKQEFNNIKSQSPELAFGDYFILPEETAQQ